MTVLPAAGNKVHIVVYVTADFNQPAVSILGKGEHRCTDVAMEYFKAEVIGDVSPGKPLSD